MSDKNTLPLAEELAKNYKKQKSEFLDNLQPDDFRNGGSFNQAGSIIDHLNKSLHQAIKNNEDASNFMQKAAENLFRNDSPAVEKLLKLSHAYLEMINSSK